MSSLSTNELKKNNTPHNLLSGCLFILVLAILSAIALPYLVDTRPRLNLKIYFAHLENGLQECMDRLKNGETTYFLDSNSFSSRAEKTHSNWRFKISKSTDKELGGDTCFAAKAVPIYHDCDTWFEIKYDLDKGTTTKSCGDPEKYGCNKNYSWSFDTL